MDSLENSNQEVNNTIDFDEGGAIEEQIETESDSHDEDAGMNSDDEYETIDVTQNPLYHVLSAFFEDDDGNNVVDKLSLLADQVSSQTKELVKTNENMVSIMKLFSQMSLRSKSKRVKQKESME